MTIQMNIHVIENTWLNGMNHGWGNGYVLIPPGHKYYGIGYDNPKLSNIIVHGGLTYSDFAQELPNIPQQFIGFWALGFDTCHCTDTQDNWPESRVRSEAMSLHNQIYGI